MRGFGDSFCIDWLLGSKYAGLVLAALQSEALVQRLE
jgi:hypothetical protein